MIKANCDTLLHNCVLYMHLTARTDVLDARKKRNDSSVYWVSVNESSDVVLDLNNLNAVSSATGLDISIVLRFFGISSF